MVKAAKRKAPGARQRLEGTMHRQVLVSRQAIVDEEARVVEFSVASEFPVPRAGFLEDPWIEILDMDGVRMGRLNNGAALLYNHIRSRENRLGAVQSARVDGGRLIVRAQFSSREDVEDVWGDVRDELLTTVSIGYLIHERVLEKANKDGPDEYRITDWEPFEVSFVDVPADPTVGVGRGQTGDVPASLYRVVDLPADGDNDEEEQSMNLRTLLAALVAHMGREALEAELTQRSNLEAAAVRGIVDGKSDDAEISTEVRQHVVDLAASQLGEVRDNPAANPPATGDQRKLEPDVHLAGDIEAARQRQIREAFKPFRAKVPDRDALERELDACLDNRQVSVDKARQRLLAMVGDGIEPAGSEPEVRAGAEGRDLFTADAERAICVRAAVPVRDAIQQSAGAEGRNPLRGFTLVELARRSLEVSGVRTEGMDRMEMVGRAFGTGDFGNILENIANKQLLVGFQEAPETWNLWTQTGSLSDFKQGKLVNLSTFDDLDLVAEGNEYRYGQFDDEGEPIQLGTYGKLFSITREAIINDDLNAFTRIPMGMGRGAARVPGDLVYAILTSNPTMADGTALFHADHNNLESSGAAPSVATISSMRQLMALQTDPNGNRVPHPLGFIIVPEALADSTRTVVASEKDTDTAGSLANNPIRNIGQVIGEHRLDDDSAVAWYGAARQGFDTIQVGFLDGNQSPTMEQKEGWSRDGVQFKVRLDAAAAAASWRGLAKNPGT